MIRLWVILFFAFFLPLTSCKKDGETNEMVLPAGATAYTAEELAFVPYSGGNRLFKKAPSFSEELMLNFKERHTPKDFYAWDQTFFTFDTDPGLTLELRFRYTTTSETSQKSLAVYMPHRGDFGNVMNTIFELPVTEENLTSGFFQNIVTFHDTINLFDTEWIDVFEVKPLSSASGVGVGTAFSKVYYNSTYGLIQLEQKNGSQWLLHP